MLLAASGVTRVAADQVRVEPILVQGDEPTVGA
jgi:hypothetical protein